MNFLEKLDLLINKHNINKSVLSKQSGVPYTTIDGFYKKGYQNAKLPTIQKIASYFNVTLDYLMIDEITDPSFGKINNFNIVADEMYFIKKIRTLTPFGRITIEENLNSLIKYESELKKAETKKAALVELKPQAKELTVYDLPASAGTGQFLDSDSYQIIEFPLNEIPKNTTFGVRVSGNSMEPQFFDKDIAFVQRVHEVSSGSIGVFILNGDAYIKKIICDQDECYLVSLNTTYDPIKIKEEDDLRTVGKVLWIS